MEKLNNYLEGVGGLVTTIEAKKTGFLMLIATLAFVALGWIAFNLYQEAIETKNNSIIEKNELIKEANKSLEHCKENNVKLSTQTVEKDKRIESLETRLDTKLKGK